MPTSANSYGPYDAGLGANITENFWRLMTRWFAPAAVLAGYLNDLAPFGDSTGLQAKVNTGAALVRGAYGEWTASTTLGLAAVGGIAGGSERWDRVIVRNDFVNNLMQLDVLTGTASASPSTVRPALTQTSSMYEMLLADVGPLVNTTTTVTAAMVLDGRWKMTESGILFHERTLAAAAATINLPAAGVIPAGIRTLDMDWSATVTSIVGVSSLALQFNGDVAANYANQNLSNLNTVVAAVLNTGQTGLRLGVVPGTAGAAFAVTTGRTTIPWANGNQRKQAHSQSYREDSTGTGSDINDGVWSGTGALTSILLFVSGASFGIGTSVVLMGRP